MKAPLVIDASVALKWFAVEPGHEEWRRGEFDAPDVARVAAFLPRAFSGLVESRELVARAAFLSVSLRHPAYDCMYLALAEDRDARLITADGRFLKLVRGTAWESFVRPLTGEQPADA